MSYMFHCKEKLTVQLGSCVLVKNVFQAVVST